LGKVVDDIEVWLTHSLILEATLILCCPALEPFPWTCVVEVDFGVMEKEFLSDPLNETMFVAITRSD
jgi:hypothetical protein